MCCLGVSRYFTGYICNGVCTREDLGASAVHLLHNAIMACFPRCGHHDDGALNITVFFDISRAHHQLEWGASTVVYVQGCGSGVPPIFSTDRVWGSKFSYSHE